MLSARGVRHRRGRNRRVRVHLHAASERQPRLSGRGHEGLAADQLLSGAGGVGGRRVRAESRHPRGALRLFRARRLRGGHLRSRGLRRGQQRRDSARGRGKRLRPRARRAEKRLRLRRSRQPEVPCARGAGGVRRKGSRVRAEPGKALRGAGRGDRRAERA